MANKLALRDQRLRMMQAVLAWEGEIGNARVREMFDIQPVQASRLLGLFRDLMGDRVMEDTRAKVIKPADTFSVETDVTLDEYSQFIMSIGSFSASIVDARIDLTVVPPAMFAATRKAILDQTGLIIEYASMQHPRFDERTIFPHAIIHAGRRWHIRAWCEKREEFRDFTLGRIRLARSIPRKAARTREDDSLWNEEASIHLVAHRLLSVEQQLLVKSEYFGGKSGRRLKVRAALAQYSIQDIRAATDPKVERPPEYQIEVSNVAELRNILF